MATTFFADTRAPGPAAHLIEHVTGPLAAGAVRSTIALAGERVIVSEPTRCSVVAARLLRPLGKETLRIAAVLDPDGAAKPLPATTFAPYSDRGALALLHAPTLAPGAATVAPFALALTVTSLTGTAAVAIAAGSIADHIEIELVEGNLGKLLFVVGAEHERLARQLRELAAMRRLSQAERDALDRFGADLGVARFDDDIAFDPASKEIVNNPRRNAAGVAIMEPDLEYRRRLQLYYPFLLPSRASAELKLNGPGAPATPNAGLLRHLGVAQRFKLLEDDNAFAVAVHIVGAGAGAHRANFLNAVRQDRLVFPANVLPANTLHAQRYLPTTRHDQGNELRASLRQSFAFADDAAIAPVLAGVLDRVGRFGRALGFDKVWNVTRAQDSAGGSRYELGLGVDIDMPTAPEIDSLRNLLLSPNRPRIDVPELEQIAVDLVSAGIPTATNDPAVEWLWQACGLRTTHPINAGTVYLSHLPVFGLVIGGPDTATLGAPVTFDARYHAPGDPGSNAALVSTLTNAAAAWTAAGGGPWDLLSDAAARTFWDRAVAKPANDPAVQCLLGAGYPVALDPAPVVVSLKQLPEELIETIVVDAPLTAGVLANQPAAMAALARLRSVLAKAGAASVLPLITHTDELILILGVIGLPQAGINLGERRATGFRWYTVPLGGGGEVRPFGSRTLFVPGAAGPIGIVALGYARTGLTDPYEFRVELPDGATLGLKAYEFLMNLLEQVYPLGVEVNTYRIRREHVDLDGDGSAEPLLPAVSRTYRKFRRRKHVGVLGSIEEN